MNSPRVFRLAGGLNTSRGCDTFRVRIQGVAIIAPSEIVSSVTISIRRPASISPNEQFESDGKARTVVGQSGQRPRARSVTLESGERHPPCPTQLVQASGQSNSAMQYGTCRLHRRRFSKENRVLTGWSFLSRGNENEQTPQET